MAMALRRKMLTVSEKVKIIQNVESNQTVLQNEVVKCSVLPPSSLSNIILRKVSVLEQESWCEHTEKQKACFIN
jgi:hypothetical protein